MREQAGSTGEGSTIAEEVVVDMTGTALVLDDLGAKVALKSGLFVERKDTLYTLLR